jgi:hypothetical protein
MYILTVTHGIDDYKDRGESPTTETFIYDDEKSCQIKLARMMIDYVREHYECWTIKDLNDLLKDIQHTPTLFTVVPYGGEEDEEAEDEDEKKKRMKPSKEGSLKYNISIPLDSFPCETVHNVLCKGEYIPYAFTYTIYELTVLPPEPNMYEDSSSS